MMSTIYWNKYLVFNATKSLSVEKMYPFISQKNKEMLWEVNIDSSFFISLQSKFIDPISDGSITTASNKKGNLWRIHETTNF